MLSALELVVANACIVHVTDLLIRHLSIADDQIHISINDAAVPQRVLRAREPEAPTSMRCSALALALGVLDVGSASPRRRMFELLAPHASVQHERERLAYFGSAEGRDDMATYCTRERRSVLEVRHCNQLTLQ